MKKNYWLIGSALLISLFIYLFYRTEKTFINQIFISIFTRETYVAIKSFMRSHLHLSPRIIYSLPEGLWVFSITLTSKNLFVKVGNFKINCIVLPLIFSIGLEFFQLLHLTNGRFDFWDIGFSILFWILANYFIRTDFLKANIFKPLTARSIVCVSSYAIVYLAHVWR